MKIVRSVAKNDLCADLLECPEIYELEDGSMLVRGWRIDADTAAQLSMPAHEDAVIVPASLLAALRK